MFLIITRDTMFFTAMKNILSKGNVVHIQNEEEIDVMLHQNAFVIIDTLIMYFILIFSLKLND